MATRLRWLPSRIPIPVAAAATLLGLSLGACGGEESAADARALLSQWANPGSACVLPENPEGIEFDPRKRFIGANPLDVPEVNLPANARATVRVYAQKPCSMDVELRCTAAWMDLSDSSPDAGA